MQPTNSDRIGQIVLLLGILSLQRALADQPKPDFAIKAKSIVASVVLDAKIKDDPALVANCLAEGKAWAQKNFTYVVKGRKESPELFMNGDWTYERSYSIHSIVGDRYVSVLRYDNSYTGGAHPNSTVDTVLWDTTAKKRISIRPFFAETTDDGPTLTAIRNAVVASLRIQKEKCNLPHRLGQGHRAEAPQDRPGNVGTIYRGLA